MFAWLNTRPQTTPEVSGRNEPVELTEGRTGMATEADFDASLSRAVHGTEMATLILQHKCNLPLAKCAGLIQMMRETTSNELMHQSSRLPALAHEPQALTALNAFVVQLHFAERLTEAVSDLDSAHEADTSHRPLLTDAWSTAAAAAKHLVDVLRCDAATDETRRCFFEIIGTRLGMIKTHLERAAELPAAQLPLVERRAHRRTLLGIWVRMATATDVGDAFLSDISATGFGIATPLCLKTGAEIQIEAPDGRILGAKVAWIQGTRAGARFLSPLPPEDTLITSNTKHLRQINLMPAKLVSADRSRLQTKLTPSK